MYKRVSAVFAGMTGECLGLVHELAAAVGNSTHVLESVGGISARYLADDTTAEQATDCFMAAVRGVSRVLALPNASPVTHVRVILTILHTLFCPSDGY